MTPTTALLILAWAAIVLLALALGGVVAQQRALQAVITRRPAPIGHTPMTGKLIDREGRDVDPPYTALFLTPDCSTCQTVIPAVIQAAADRADKKAPIYVVSDRPYPSDGYMSLNSVQWIADDSVAQHFGIPAFPWLVTVASDGSVIDHNVAHDPNDAATRIRNTSAKMLSEKGATS